ncbi:SixA phosphatase family protein [Nemorincola caseinilytica]
MERTLVVIRHAKSSWNDPLKSDFERPLNDRGNRDAPEMAARLKKAGLIPDLVIASSAKRTRQTALLMAEVLGYDKDRIQLEEKLYHCVPATMEEVLYAVADDVSTVFMVAHNPGITEFANQLSPQFYVGNLPTCGVVAASFSAASWAELATAKKNVFLYDTPKNEHDR